MQALAQRCQASAWSFVSHTGIARTTKDTALRYIKTLTTGLFVSFLALTSIACGDGDPSPTGGSGPGGGGSGGTTTTTDTGGGGSGGTPTTSSSSTTTTTTSGPEYFELTTCIPEGNGNDCTFAYEFGPYVYNKGPQSGTIYYERGDWAPIVFVPPPGGPFHLTTLYIPSAEGGFCALLDTTVRTKVVNFADLNMLPSPNEAGMWDATYNIGTSDFVSDAWTKELAASLTISNGQVLAQVIQMNAESDDPNTKRTCVIAYGTPNLTPYDLWFHDQAECYDGDSSNDTEKCGYAPLDSSPDLDPADSHWGMLAFGYIDAPLPVPGPQGENSERQYFALRTNGTHQRIPDPRTTVITIRRPEVLLPRPGMIMPVPQSSSSPN